MFHPQEIRLYLEQALRKIHTPLRLGCLTSTDAEYQAPANTGPMYSILHWFTEPARQGKPDAGSEAQRLEEKMVQGDAQGLSSDKPTSSPEAGGRDTSQDRDTGAGSRLDGSQRRSSHDWQNCEIESSLQGRQVSEVDTGVAASQFSFPEENRIVVLQDLISVLLTEETLKHISATIVASNSLNQQQRKYDQVKKEASIGETFLRNAEAHINNVETPEDYRESQKESLQQRLPKVMENIRRANEMERELGIQRCNLEYSRERLDRVFQQVLTEVGMMDEPENEAFVEERQAGTEDEATILKQQAVLNYRTEIGRHQSSQESRLSIPEPQSNQEVSVGTTALLDSTMGRLVEHFPVYANEDVAQEARARLDLATENVERAKAAFQQRHVDYLNDIQDYEDVCSKTDIDVYHVQRGTELTRAYREAERDWEKAREQAKALGLLANYATQEFDFVDEDDNGYRESQDPAHNSVDRYSIESWIAEVVGGLEEVTQPDSQDSEWCGESVNISDAGSAVNTCAAWRKAIDCWHAQQAELRLQFEDLTDTPIN